MDSGSWSGRRDTGTVGAPPVKGPPCPRTRSASGSSGTPRRRPRSMPPRSPTAGSPRRCPLRAPSDFRWWRGRRRAHCRLHAAGRPVRRTQRRTDIHAERSCELHGHHSGPRRDRPLLGCHRRQRRTESACGWCKDRWGFSWQITPRALTEAMAAGGEEAAPRLRGHDDDAEDRRGGDRGGPARLTACTAQWPRTREASIGVELRAAAASSLPSAVRALLSGHVGDARVLVRALLPFEFVESAIPHLMKVVRACPRVRGEG